jgi:hypothetical protein
VVLEKNEGQLNRPCEKMKTYYAVKEERNILQITEWKRANCIGHILSRNCLPKDVIKERKKEG